MKVFDLFTDFGKVKQQFENMSHIFKCKIFDETFEQNEELDLHLKIGHMEPKDQNHSCDLCEMTFTNKGTLRKHLIGVHNKKDSTRRKFSSVPPLFLLY